MRSTRANILRGLVAHAAARGCAARRTAGLVLLTLLLSLLLLAAGCVDDSAEKEQTDSDDDSDSTAPASISDLAADSATRTSVTLSFTSVGGDGASSGRAAVYDARYATSDITDDETCDAATAFETQQRPRVAERSESLTVTGLAPDTTYFFCVRAVDRHENVGAWADSGISTTTTSGDLSLATVVLDTDDVDLTLDLPVGVAVASNGRSVYVSSTNDEGLSVFQRDPETYELTFAEFWLDSTTNGLAGAGFVTISADQAHLIVSGETDDASTVFRRDTSTGLLTYDTLYKDGDAIDGGTLAQLTPKQGVFSPDGVNYYIAAQGSDAIVAYTRNYSTGELTYLSSHTAGGDLTGVTALAISNDGLFLYGTTLGNDKLVVMARDAEDGTLSKVQTLSNVDHTELDVTAAVVVSPDDQNVYVTANGSSAILAFTRDVDTGELTLLEVFTSSEIPELGSTGPVAISPDGYHVFVGANTSDALIAFARDPETGSLSQQQILTIVDVPDMDAPNVIAVSPEGDQVFVTASDSNALVVFDRD